MKLGIVNSVTSFINSDKLSELIPKSFLFTFKLSPCYFPQIVRHERIDVCSHTIHPFGSCLDYSEDFIRAFRKAWKILIAKHKKESMHNMGKGYEFLLPTSPSSIFQTYMESAWLCRRNTRPGEAGLDIPLLAFTETSFMLLHRHLIP